MKLAESLRSTLFSNMEEPTRRKRVKSSGYGMGMVVGGAMTGAAVVISL